MERNEREIARKYALDWLNSLGGDPLPDDYFTDVVVMSDSGEMMVSTAGRAMLFEFHSDDDGGPALMFAHFEEDTIVWSAWYFDGTWGEMRWGEEGK